ncbi:phytoene desaturase family protein [Candidatus Mycobacterium methanotrophicum]|uniref:NAD(P)/FAD-dependent oxidoreductase n=1 Tax=Candidatus Mycobacterium methanotrophicum TaxID=2943498 RepID=A0ABY4QL97_9MYCO|nr:NAD(P)/FAD-dependent oxidoreductase [Candidatus Mycobacterium methanotrophicum]UQX11374.1 NAD(P)/FAD-dependent oxidoreductase [Candidatus Mycobacterium methanotrophicum]
MAADPGGVDVVVVGGGHNGLVAAAYLARAGLRVRLLERLGHVGGAAVSAQVFSRVEARLSRYAYLVSLLPTRITDDLGAPVRLARRPYSSYTPDPDTAGRTGLLVGPDCTFDAIGAPDDERAFAAFYRRCRLVTERLWPTLLEPLRTREQARLRVVAGGDTEAAAAWRAMVERPIGDAIADAIGSDLVRGVVATDALIGTFARLDDPSLRQNVCFLYHLLGGGTGEWRVPVGGMGAVSAALAAAAVRKGAEIVTGAEVYGVDPDGEVRYRRGDDEHVVRGRFVLAGVTPTVLAGLLGEQAPPPTHGAQVKVNMVVRRLPRLRDPSVTPEQAFGGTLHINETWTQLDAAYSRAAAAALPEPLPCEIYCHSLTDPTILSPGLRESGAATLTVFGLHTPHSLNASRHQLTDAVLNSLNCLLAEPIQDVLLGDADGLRCIETTTTVDLEHALGMTGGNIFHGDLHWPFADDHDRLDTPARRWGVATAHDRILLCGAGARRGGAVSGIGGHNAAMAVLGSLASRRRIA